MKLNLEDIYIQIASVSEFWAYHDLMQKAELFPEHAELLKKQAADEYRHGQMLEDCISGTVWLRPPFDTSMQETIYRNCLQIDLSKSQTDFARLIEIHEITERRALWIYRAYLRVMTNEKYKKVIRQIMVEEQDHFYEHPPYGQVAQSIQRLETWFFSVSAPAVYGHRYILKEDFWHDYLRGQIRMTG